MNPFKHWSTNLVGICGAGVVAGLPLLMPSAAEAQAAYGSYIGAGPAVGLISGSGSAESSRVSGLITARYKLLEIPISIRGQVFLFSGTTAIVPMVSYDLPLNWQTDIYLGAGYSFANGTDASPIGNQNAFVLQPGIDYMLPNSNLALFGSSTVAFDAFKSGSGTAISIQAGVGLRF